MNQGKKQKERGAEGWWQKVESTEESEMQYLKCISSSVLSIFCQLPFTTASSSPQN